MANCIYRNVPLNNSVPQDKDTASVEHIIPWALGGSNGLVTPDASKGANNDLGSEVDARFANTLPLAIKRHHLQLKSQNGNIEPIVWPAETIDGDKATITIDHLGNVGAKLRVIVQTPDGPEGGKMVIKGEREQVEPIIKGMLAKWMAKGISAYSEDGKLLTSLDDFFEESDQQDVDQFRARVEYFNKEAWTRGILKIALGVGHLILGREWTFGRDADVLRQYVLNSKDNWPTTGRGVFGGRVAPFVAAIPWKDESCLGGKPTHCCRLTSI